MMFEELGVSGVAVRSLMMFEEFGRHCALS